MTHRPDASTGGASDSRRPVPTQRGDIELSAGQALERAIAERTPARVLVGRAGPGYRTTTQLDLKADHAFAVDAVREPLDLARHLGDEAIHKWRLFEVSTAARDKEEYLTRPDLGRLLAPAARDEIASRCPRQADLQVVIGDGLSVAALIHVPAMLAELQAGAERRGWTLGQSFVARHCRVGVMNDVGELLAPTVVVLLIGERPGLATAESLSAYLAFEPRLTDTDAQRNLISNIHRQGVSPAEAAARVLALADEMRRQRTSGVTVKEVSRPRLE